MLDSLQTKRSFSVQQLCVWSAFWAMKAKICLNKTLRYCTALFSFGILVFSWRKVRLKRCWLFQMSNNSLRKIVMPIKLKELVNQLRLTRPPSPITEVKEYATSGRLVQLHQLKFALSIGYRSSKTMLNCPTLKTLSKINFASTPV